MVAFVTFVVKFADVDAFATGVIAAGNPYGSGVTPKANGVYFLVIQSKGLPEVLENVDMNDLIVV
jgi:hypothetical protein